MLNKIYELLRKRLAKKATGNLGKVEIHDDEIVCYVDERKLKTKEKYLSRYKLIFKCIPLNNEIYELYHLNKPVHYIVENAIFDKEINIMASMKNCYVTFKNCTFTGAIEIDFADRITFINNTYVAQNYKNICSIYKEGEFCISTYKNKNEINKIEIFNDRIETEPSFTIPTIKAKEKYSKVDKVKKPIVEIWLSAREIIIKKTDILDVKSININSDKLLLSNTNIKSEEIEINATYFENDYSKIQSDIITINTDEYNQNNTVISSKAIFINGIEKNRNEKNITPDTLKLQKQRLELIDTLNKIERKCEKQIREEIKRQPLTRVLKK